MQPYLRLLKPSYSNSNMDYPYRKRELFLISFVLGGAQNKSNNTKCNNGHQNTGINSLFKGMIQGSIFYFVIWKKVGLKAVRTVCSR